MRFKLNRAWVGKDNTIGVLKINNHKFLYTREGPFSTLISPGIYTLNIANNNRYTIFAVTNRKKLRIHFNEGRGDIIVSKKLPTNHIEPDRKAYNSLIRIIKSLQCMGKPIELIITNPAGII